MTASSARPARAHAPGSNDRAVGGFVVRFDRTERLVHWLSAAAVLVAVATGAILYVAPLAIAIGRRAVVRDLHVASGIASVVPIAIGLAGPWRDGLRRDVARFAHWHDDDLRWFRRRHRRAAETGKFTGGQKLNAVLMSSALVVLLMTGAVMRWFGPFPLEWRTGATFVHDYVSFGLWVLVPVHVVKAVATRGAVRGMWTGWVRREEAERRPRWWESVTDDG